MSYSSRSSSLSKLSHKWQQQQSNLQHKQLKRRGSTEAPAYTPLSLIRHHTLPVAAYFQSPDVPAGLDASQPILLYESYTSKKVRAASLQISRESGLLAVGPTLVIPDSYSGWFSVITSKGSSAPFMSSIEEVSKSQPLFFLTRYDITAYVKEMDPEECNRVTYRKFTVKGGHVLKLLGIFEDLNRKKISGESINGKNKFAQCLNHLNEVIFVPFSVTGRFYETAQRGSTNVNNVFLASQILSTFQLPLNVRLVCGYMPRVPEAFTGVLRLEKIEKETVILGCTITSEAKATLLEMDIASNFLLRPIVDPMYMKTPIFLKSVSYCSEEADSWRRQIKVIHHITEDESGSFLRRSSVSGSSIGSSLSFFENFDRLRGKERDKSKSRPEKSSKSFFLRDKSKDNNHKVNYSDKHGNEKSKNKENRDNDDSRSKDSRSRDSRLKIKVKDKIQDLTRNRQYVVNGEFIAIRVDDKLNGKKGFENRKVSKQNTYIFQNDKIIKPDKKLQNSDAEENSTTNIIKSQDEYATVLDDVSRIRKETTYEQTETQYAEICDQKTAISQNKIKVAHTVRICS